MILAEAWEARLMMLSDELWGLLLVFFAIITQRSKEEESLGKQKRGVGFCRQALTPNQSFIMQCSSYFPPIFCSLIESDWDSHQVLSAFLGYTVIKNHQKSLARCKIYLCYQSVCVVIFFKILILSKETFGGFQTFWFLISGLLRLSLDEEFCRYKSSSFLLFLPPSFYIKRPYSKSFSSLSLSSTIVTSIWAFATAALTYFSMGNILLTTHVKRRTI